MIIIKGNVKKVEHWSWNMKSLNRAQFEDLNTSIQFYFISVSLSLFYQLHYTLQSQKLSICSGHQEQSNYLALKSLKTIAIYWFCTKFQQFKGFLFSTLMFKLFFLPFNINTTTWLRLYLFKIECTKWKEKMFQDLWTINHKSVPSAT